MGRRPATFTESYRWIDGVAVEIVQIDHSKLLAPTAVDSPNARAGDPCSELTIVVRNGSDHKVRVALTARLRFGPGLTRRPATWPQPGTPSTRPRSTLTPERLLPVHSGVRATDRARDNVVLELGIDNWRHERAVFAGTIATG